MGSVSTPAEVDTDSAIVCVSLLNLTSLCITLRLRLSTETETHILIDKNEVRKLSS